MLYLYLFIYIIKVTGLTYCHCLFLSDTFTFNYNSNLITNVRIDEALETTACEGVAQVQFVSGYIVMSLHPHPFLQKIFFYMKLQTKILNSFFEKLKLFTVKITTLFKLKKKCISKYGI